MVAAQSEAIANIASRPGAPKSINALIRQHISRFPSVHKADFAFVIACSESAEQVAKAGRKKSITSGTNKATAYKVHFRIWDRTPLLICFAVLPAPMTHMVVDQVSLASSFSASASCRQQSLRAERHAKPMNSRILFPLQTEAPRNLGLSRRQITFPWPHSSTDYGWGATTKRKESLLLREDGGR